MQSYIVQLYSPLNYFGTYYRYGSGAGACPLSLLPFEAAAH